MNKMNKTKAILIVSIIGGILLLSGLTYAYIRVSRTQEDQNNLSTLTCLDFSIESTEDGQGNVISSAINLTNAYPVPDAEGLLNEPYLFTVKNNCSRPIIVELNLETLNTSTLDKTHVKVNYVNNTTSANFTSLLSDRTAKAATIEDENENIISTSNYLDTFFLGPTGSNNASRDLSLRLWVDEATTWQEGNNKTFAAKITATGKPTVTYTPNFGGGQNSLLAAIENGDYLFTHSFTTPGKQPSLEEENLIDRTEDDYGTSYYFRGNVKNNYVVFNNMCWRIIRIDGEGNIKLLLHNERGIDCTLSYPYARWDGNSTTTYYIGTEQTYTTTSGTTASVRNTSVKVGIMYGDAAADNYNDAQANIHDNTILTSLKSWYDRVFRTEDGARYEALLADVIWCNDKSVPTGIGGYGNLTTSYGAKERLHPGNNANNAVPSLVCPNAGPDGKLSKFTAQDSRGNGMLKTEEPGEETKYYKIGLLTADEAAFAGGTAAQANTSYFLRTGVIYWTMSPTNQQDVYSIIENGMIQWNWNHLNSSLSLRPAVSLKSNVKIVNSNATGTAEDPYVISLN